MTEENLDQDKLFKNLTIDYTPTASVGYSSS